jgi:DNA-binding transcriptional MerR regulator
MFRIGEFSKFSRVSIKMLRHYDRLGLLKPARIDPATRYRYYSADQLPRLNRILALRDLGLSLEQIAPLLDEAVSLVQIRGMLALKRAELEQHLLNERRRLDRIEARLGQIDQQGRAQAVEIIVRRIEPICAAALRQVIDDNEDMRYLFEEVEMHVARHHARADQAPLAIYHDAEYREGELDVEVAIPVSAHLPGTSRITVYELSGYDSVACLVHSGRYDAMDETNAALLTWIETNGYGIAGASREVYLRFSAAGLDIDLPPAYLTHNADEFVTEVQIPVTRNQPKGGYTWPTTL